MSKDKQIHPEDFIEGRNFSRPFYSEIVQELITKYKKESPRQHAIRATVMLFEKKYKAEMRAFNKQMEKARDGLKNKFAANKEQDQRLFLKLPPSLWNRISMITPDKPFLEDDSEMEWFMKEFPNYVVPKEI
jgi:uncharacterized membrane-anchored protein YjiN (DUF445 family)